MRFFPPSDPPAGGAFHCWERSRIPQRLPQQLDAAAAQSPRLSFPPPWRKFPPSRSSVGAFLLSLLSLLLHRLLLVGVELGVELLLGLGLLREREGDKARMEGKQ